MTDHYRAARAIGVSAIVAFHALFFLAGLIVKACT